jgi:hypothetical protein
MSADTTSRSTARRLGGLALLLVALPLVGFALVVIADAIPDRAITRHLGTEILNERLTTEDYGTALSGHEIDRFTDCIGITIGLGSPPGTNTIESAISSPTLGSCSEAIPRLQSYLDGEGLEQNYPYYRYWHGYSVVLRPLLALVGLQGTRVLMLVALAGVLLGLGRSLSRRHGRAVPLVLLAPFVLTTDFIELPGSLPHATGALAILATTWFAHEVVSRSPTWPRVAAASIIAGAVVVFSDILTIPAGGWALTTAVIGIGASLTLARLALAVQVAVAAAAWITGWTWMWVSKWILASTVFGVDSVIDVIRFTTENRLTGDNGSIDDSVLATIRLNAEVWWSQPLAGATVAGLLVVFVTVWRRRGRWFPPRGRWIDRVIIATPAVIPFAWYELLKNHSQVHVWFTYRSIPLALGIVAASTVMTMRVRHSDATAADELTDDAQRDRQPAATRPPSGSGD